MDSPGDWTATALFSPSKARAQQAQARDWAFVDAWLSKQYGKRIPAFERNEDTSQALLTLATLNEDADEQCGLIEKIERTALQALKQGHHGDDFFGTLLDSLSRDGQEALDALANSSVLLDTSDLNVNSGRLCELTAEHFELSEQVSRTEAQHTAIRSEQARLERLLKELRAEELQPPDNILEQTAEWARNTKHLKAKPADYDERLGGLQSTALPSPTLEDVSRHTAERDTLRNKTHMLSIELSAFDSLPPDAKAAKTKLERARTDLRALVTRRDRLFESLAEND